MTTSSDAPKRRLAAPERRNQLLEAAREAYAARGLAATGKDIAAVAGINEALIYRHFETKEGLLAAAVFEPLEQLVNQAVAVGRAFPPYVEQGAEDIRRFIAQLLTLLVEAMPLLGVVLFSENGQQFYREQIARAIDTLSAGVQEDALPAWDLRDFRPQLVVTLIFSMCLGVALDARFRGTELDVEATSAEIGDLIFNGLRARLPE